MKRLHTNNDRRNYGEIIQCEKPAPNTEKYIKAKETICSTEEQLLEQFPDCKELLDTNAGGIEGVSQKRTRMCAYKADVEIQTHSTLCPSLSVKLTSSGGSGSELR